MYNKHEQDSVQQGWEIFEGLGLFVDQKEGQFRMDEQIIL